MSNSLTSDASARTPQMIASGRRLLTEPEAAAYLRISRSFLAKARCSGAGPIFVKCGRRVLYDLADLDAFADRGKRRSTSSTAP
jgi:helix-turn-helix protein